MQIHLLQTRENQFSKQSHGSAPPCPHTQTHACTHTHITLTTHPLHLGCALVLCSRSPTPQHRGPRGLFSDSLSQGCALAPPQPGARAFLVCVRQPHLLPHCHPPDQTPPQSHLMQAGTPAQGRFAVPTPHRVFILRVPPPSCQRTPLSPHRTQFRSSSWHSGGCWYAGTCIDICNCLSVRLSLSV